MTDTMDIQSTVEVSIAITDSMEPSCSYSVQPETPQVQEVEETKPIASPKSPKEPVPEDPFNKAIDQPIAEESLEESPLLIDVPVEESKTDRTEPMEVSIVEEKPASASKPSTEVPVSAPAEEEKTGPIVAAPVEERKPSPIRDAFVTEHKNLLNSLLVEVTESLRKQDELEESSLFMERVTESESKPLEEMGPLEYFTAGLKKSGSSVLKTPRSVGNRRRVSFIKVDEDSSPLASFLPSKEFSAKRSPSDKDVKITGSVQRKRKAHNVEQKVFEDKENATAPTPKRSRRPSAIKREILEHEPETPKTPVARTPKSARKAPAPSKKSSANKNQSLTTPKAERRAPTTSFREEITESEDSSSCDDSEEEFVILDERKKKRSSGFRTKGNDMEDGSDDDASSVRTKPSPARKPKTPRTPKISVKKEITIGEYFDNGGAVVDSPGRVRNFCSVCDDYIHKPGEKNQGPRRHIFTTHLGVKLFQCLHCDHASVHDSYHVKLHSKRVHKDESGEIRNLEPEYEDDIRYWMKECFGVMGRSARSPDDSKRARKMAVLRTIKKEEPEEEEEEQEEILVTSSTPPAKPTESPTRAPDSDDDFDYDSLTYSPNGPIVMTWEELQKTHRILD